MSCVSSVNSDAIIFRLVGFIGSVEFQKCLAYIQRLNKSYPKLFVTPVIRGMLPYDWEEYLIKVQRRLGGALWSLKKQAAVFINGFYLGDDLDLSDFISNKYQLSIKRNFEDLARKSLLDLFVFHFLHGRKFVFFTISINTKTIGTMIFMLYADLVPKTCNRFLRKCKNIKHGYTGTIVHRIMDASWIQVGGFNMSTKSRTCENYIIPHNRRGIISMCNDGRHTHNTTQFHISLGATPWMDYKYVAIGQLIQGNEVLKQIEKVKTVYNYPGPDTIIIIKAGEFTLDQPNDKSARKALDTFLEVKDSLDGLEKPKLVHTDLLDPRDCSSELFSLAYKKGLYYLEDDDQTNLPLFNLPSYLISKNKLLAGSCSTYECLYPNVGYFNDEADECKEIEEVEQPEEFPKFGDIIHMSSKESVHCEEPDSTQIVQNLIDTDLLAFLQNSSMGGSREYVFDDRAQIGMEEFPVVQEAAEDVQIV